MQISRIHLLLATLLIVALAALGCSNSDNGTGGGGDNPGDNVSQTNSVRIDCPVTINSPSTDTTVLLDVYLTTDTSFAGFTLGFKYNGTGVVVDSVYPGPALTSPDMLLNNNRAAKTCLVGWVDFTAHNPMAAGQDVKAFTFALRVSAGAPSQSINFDSTFIPPSAIWWLTTGGGGVRPDLDDCGSADVIIQ